MKQQHTPGPWEYEHFDGESFELKTTQPGEYEPIITGCGCCGSPRLSKDADGKLIAAAPELLAALQAFDQAMENADDWPDTLTEKTILLGVVLAARSAIAKAEGGAE